MERTSSASLDCTVSETAGFRYIARIAPVALPGHTLSFSLHSTWTGATDPGAERRVVQFNLDADALTRLCALLEAGRRLAEPRQAERDRDHAAGS